MTRSEARLLRIARRWHRRGALLVALWLAVLAITGSAINRAHDWGLDRAGLPGPMQRALYGIERQNTEPCAGLEPVPDAFDRVFARLALDTGSVLLAPHGVLLLDPDGQLVEILPAGQLGLTRIDAGFVNDAWVYLRGGQRTVAADSGLLELREPGAVELAALEQQDWKSAHGDASAGAITWERLLLDLHAARFLGPGARWFTDLMAALILALVVSGLWLYRLRGRNSER